MQPHRWKNLKYKTQGGKIMKIKKIILYTSIPVILIACFVLIYKTDLTNNKKTGNTSQQQIPISENTTNKTTGNKSTVNTQTKEEYNIINPSGKTLATRIRTPEGYRRTKASRNSFEKFLRNYKMKKHGKPVLLYNGSKKANQSAHAAIFKLPIENEDLQQCADSVMRVYAEYFWHTNQKSRIKFHFVDGFLAEYSKWQAGSRIQVTDNGSYWINSSAADSSYGTFKKFMRMVFAYSGTLSMEAEAKKIKKTNIHTGDIFINGGSPGHVVMVADTCKNKDGKKAFLLAQGYMPAQEFHVLKNPSHEEDPWYYEEEIKFPFVTPEYIFDKGSLKRLNY